MLVYKVSNFYKSHFKSILFSLFLGLALLAWSNRFIQDDAFISFRYADNFVHGKGLVWNPGEPVEGYTNFLWTILISVPLYLNLDPVRFSFVVGVFLFVLSLYFTYRLALTLLHSQQLAFAAVILLGTNYSFSSYATGGMETQLQTCLSVACLFLLCDSLVSNNWPALRLLMISVLLSLAILTRLDSLLLLVVVLPVTLFHVFRGEKTAAGKLWSAGSLFAPLALLVGTWLIWKMRFYGSVLPNSFYVKVSSLTSLKRGLIYVYLFFHSYWLVIFPFLFLVFGNRLLGKANRQWLILSITIVGWLVYVVAVGGDFMEFRFIVPVLPFIFIQIVWLIFVQVRKVKIQIALFLIVLAGSVHHAVTFTNPSVHYYDVDSTKGLSGFIQLDRSDWAGIGKVLGESFAYDPNVTIATTAAGAIPYFSRLTTIDILGLNDRWVARHGEIVVSKPGHQRRATLNYLLERKVNLLIGHPQMVPIDSTDVQPWSDYYFYVRITAGDKLPANSTIIEIPINSKYKLRVLYLVANPRIDEAIKKHGWATFPFVRGNR